MKCKLGRKQVIGIGITAAGFFTSTILLGVGKLTGEQWCNFNGAFLPWMVGILAGGAAVASLGGALAPKPTVPQTPDPVPPKDPL